MDSAALVKALNMTTLVATWGATIVLLIIKLTSLSDFSWWILTVPLVVGHSLSVLVGVAIAVTRIQDEGGA